MNKLLIIILAVTPLLTISCSMKRSRTIEDDKLISLVLHASYKDGGYTVVVPKTEIGHCHLDDPQDTARIKNFILKHLKVKGCNMRKLVDRFIERNKGSNRLSLESSPSDGYIIDYDGKYESLFSAGGGRWEQLHKEDPRAHSLTRVSLPAYDPKSNIFLIYTGTVAPHKVGSGWILAYRYKDGKLELVSRVMVWVT